MASAGTCWSQVHGRLVPLLKSAYGSMTYICRRDVDLNNTLYRTLAGNKLTNTRLCHSQLKPRATLIRLLNKACSHDIQLVISFCYNLAGSVAERLACWTQAQKARVQIAAATLSGNSLRQTVYTCRASIYRAAKLVAALLRVAGVTAGLAESNGSLPPGLWLMSPAG